jgi:quinol-cytochrome oxidoreductase complex cytochrome b subunit
VAVAVAVEPERTAVQQAQRVLLAVLGVLFLVLLATGLWLVFRYQPSGSFQGSRPQSGLRVAHRVASTAFLFTAVATFGVSIAVSFERRLSSGVPAWLAGAVLALGVVASSFTGYLLPWDQLALSRVTTGVDIRGYGWLFGHPDVRFVLIRGSEITKATMRIAFFVHTVAIPLALVALGVALARVTRRARLTEPPPA